MAYLNDNESWPHSFEKGMPRRLLSLSCKKHREKDECPIAKRWLVHIIGGKEQRNSIDGWIEVSRQIEFEDKGVTSSNDQSRIVVAFRAHAVVLEGSVLCPIFFYLKVHRSDGQNGVARISPCEGRFVESGLRLDDKIGSSKYQITYFLIEQKFLHELGKN